MSDQSLAERIAAMIEAEKPAAQEPELELERRPLAYSFKDAAKAMGVGLSTIEREVRAGRLKKVKVRRRAVITDDELRRFLDECATHG